MVTVTVDPASTRNGSIDLRSGIYFDNCTFNGGLTIVGDYHAMVSLGEGCSFGDGAVVTFREATSGATKEMTLEDNFVKIMVSCPGVTVETECAVGVVTGRDAKHVTVPKYDVLYPGFPILVDFKAPFIGYPVHPKIIIP